MVISSSHEFSNAVRAYRFENVTLDDDAVAAAAESLRTSGLVLVGEPHGVYETPAVLYAIIVALDVRAVALEWSHDELERHVQTSLSFGAFDFTEYWRLPATAEFFAGDGRITAGHFALLERLRAERRLDQLVLYDRLDTDSPPPDWHVRDREMATRLLDVWDGQRPLLVLSGAFHVQTQPQDGAEPLGGHIARARPGIKTAMLDYRSGFCWSRGATHDLVGPMPEADIVFRLPRGTPADVPGQL